MKPSFNPPFPYEIVLTTFVVVSTFSCGSADKPQPITVVTVPNESAPAPAASVGPAAPKDPSRSGRLLWTWETSTEYAWDRAYRDKLPVLVYVRADWSAGSLEMDRTVWSDPRILFQSHPVVPLRADVTDGPEAELMAAEFHVQLVPAVILLGEGGRELVRLEGARSVEEVLEVLRKVDER